MPLPPDGKSPVVLIYLPRGPLSSNPVQDASNIASLRSILPAPIVQLNYRCSTQHRFPTAVHDVLCGYDWVVSHLLHQRAISRPGRASHIGKVAVCGELVGGSLATMLALTECRLGQPGVAAAAVNNPVVDWIFPDPASYIAKSKATPSFTQYGNYHHGITATDLVNVRKNVFGKPEHYFDPFASPVLFFRSSGADVPPPPKVDTLDDLAQLSLLDRDDFYRQQMGLAAISAQTVEPIHKEVEDSKTARRKVSRRFPSRGSGLRLPNMHVSTGTTSPLLDQTNELVSLMRKSVMRQTQTGIANESDFGRKELLDGEEDQLSEEQVLAIKQREREAKEKVQLHSSQRLGLWDQEGIARVAKWLRATLE